MVDIKKQYEKAAEPLTAKDKIYVDTTDGGVPVTKAEQIIRKNRDNMEPITAGLAAPFQLLGNLVLPGKPFGKDNMFLQDQETLNQRKIELAQLKSYRKKRDMVRDKIAILVNTATQKYQETGDKKYLNQALESKNKIMRAAGFTNKDFIKPNSNRLLFEDDFGLFTNTPDPYPLIEVGGEMLAGTIGSIKGYGYGQKLAQKKYANLIKRGAMNVKGPWWARALGAIMVGSPAVGVADYGYEVMLDVMDKAGRAKEFLRLSDNKLNNLMSKAIPESLTFGPEGINRPDQATRIKGAVTDAAIDAGITSVFFGARPAYLSLRRVIGGNVFGMFRQPAGKGVKTGQEILKAEQDLYKWAEGSVKARPQTIALDMPLIGKTLTRLANSKIFNFLGPTDMKQSKFWPDLKQITGTEVQRVDVGSPLLSGLMKVFGRAPILGGRIYKNKAQQMDTYFDLGDKLIQSLTMAPLLNVEEYGGRIIGLSVSRAKGFVEAARKMEEALLTLGRSYGAVVDDTNLVREAKRIVDKAEEMKQKIPTEDGRGIAAVPKEYDEPFIRFLENQIIKPGVQGGRTISEYYGLRQQMDKLFKTFKDKADTGESIIDMHRLYKTWETDIGSLADSGIPQVEKAWRNYENFVSNGLILFNTKAGKAMTGGVERFRFNLNYYPTRHGVNLFDTVVNIAKEDPVNARANLTAMKNIIGDKAYYEGVGAYIHRVFDQSIVDKDGAQLFDAEGFAREMGIGKGNPLSGLFDAALPGPKVTKLQVFDPETGLTKTFDEEKFNVALKDAGYQLPEQVPKGKLTQLPTKKDFENFATIMGNATKNGIPDISTFMARRAVMGGIRSSVRSILPSQSLGIGSKASAVAAGGAFAGFTGWVVPSLLAFGVRYMGGVMTNPVALKAYTNALDETIATQFRIANFIRLVRLLPEEFAEFDRDLAEVERSQRYRDQVGEAFTQTKSTTQKIIEGGGQIIDQVKELPFATEGPIPDMIQNFSPNNQQQMFAPEATDLQSSVGTSIMGNPIMNPQAAGSLYTGNVDQALANQYSGSPVRAKDGGIISLVS